MDSDKLHEQFKIYQEMAKQDKSIDVAGLMMQALDTKDKNYIPAGKKRLAYLVSIGFPPFGLIFALQFWFSDKEDGPQTAVICVVMTAAAAILLVVMTGALFSGSGVTPDQLEQINPEASAAWSNKLTVT
jgi:hypothetical protein